MIFLCLITAGAGSAVVIGLKCYGDVYYVGRKKSLNKRLIINRDVAELKQVTLQIDKTYTLDG